MSRLCCSASSYSRGPCDAAVISKDQPYSKLHYIFLRGVILALTRAFARSYRDAHAHSKIDVNTIAQFFIGHLKATLLEMLPGHWANKGQGGYEIVCLTGPFPPRVPVSTFIANSFILLCPSHCEPQSLTTSDCNEIEASG